MIEVIEGKHAPEAVRAIRPDAPWFMLVDPNVGSAMGRAEAEEDMRRIYRATEHVIFMHSGKRVDGTIVYVGSKVDPLVAEMRTGRNR